MTRARDLADGADGSFPTGIDGTVIGGTTPAAGSFTTGTFSGNVGVGTAAQDTRLEVAAPSGDVVKVTGQGVTADVEAALVFNPAFDINARIVAQRFGSSLTSVLRFETGTASDGLTTERMRIDASGNVGIGGTPEATWPAVAKVLELSGATNDYIAMNSGGQGFLYQNAYFNGTNNVYKNTGPASAYGQLSGAHAFYTGPSGSAGATATLTERMRIDSAGNVGIGVASPDRLLHLSSQNFSTTNVNNSIRITDTDPGVSNPQTLGLLEFESLSSTISGVVGKIECRSTSTVSGSANGNLVFSTGVNGASLVDNMTLDASGNLLVGTANDNPIVSGATGFVTLPGGGFRQSSTSAASYMAVTTTSGTHLTFYSYNGAPVSAGVITSNGSVTSYTGTSDYRLKDNQQPITGLEGLEFVSLLQPKRWIWTTDNRPDAGFVAHELATVSPNSVFGEKDAVDGDGAPVYQSADPSSPEIIANMVAAINELTARLDALEAP